MVKKAIDSRIPALIRNGAQEKKRSFFVIVGDRQKDVIVNLYHILLNVDIKLNKSVLWAYKNKLLGFTSHRAKREKKIRKEIKRGIRDPDVQDPFELFVSTQNIRYVYYKGTENIMGNTYGMCILQDFEGTTPNLLARTIETVEGGGLVLLLLKGMNSLKQLYTLSMDVHSRYRTEAHSDVTARFNERFILSLGSCESCLVVDDELNVLPISGGKNVKQLTSPDFDEEIKTESKKELDKIKEDIGDAQPISSLISLAKTVDQAKALLTFVDAISEKTLQSTVALTAARGRGKSAALGVSIAAAVAHGYSNIFITSPSPENLKTLFEFIFKGFDALDYQDHLDYTVIQSSNPDFNKAVVRVNIHRQHRQTIQYIQPQDAYTLGQAELLVIDEAAAIPLPFVKNLLGPYLVFMASTINGYEGTGRSLSLKLINQLREQSRGRLKTNDRDKDINRVPNTRSLREITLSEPIRYAQGDGVEKWLNRLLCLDATLPQRSSVGIAGGTPIPNECQLLAVNRDTLFSFHPVSERFLHSMLSLYVASHYKNSPNDLQLMSDAPAHHLYVLVPPISDDSNRLPEPLCVIQVALEGRISKSSVKSSLSRGQRAGGDLIPWTISQQFQDEDFAVLSGARIVRIATNPEYIGMGYGKRALDLLIDFYSGKFLSLDENDEVPDEPQSMVRVTDEELENAALLDDNVKVRDINSMPPLFSRLSEIRPPSTLDYIGVSYGLTGPLHKFWKRAKFAPVYLRQTANELTGEHTCIMLRMLNEPEEQSHNRSKTWLGAFTKDFHKRFLSLLSYNFRTFPVILALSIDESALAAFKIEPNSHQPLDMLNGIVAHEDPQINNQILHSQHNALTRKELMSHFTAHDLHRLSSYANNMLDYHAILDLLPEVSSLYFAGPLRHNTTNSSDSIAQRLNLTGVQQALLLAIGCQRKDVEEISKELGLNGTSQLLAMFVKMIRKIDTLFKGIREGEAAKDIPEAAEEDGNIEYIDNDLHADKDISTDHEEEDTVGGITTNNKKKRKKHDFRPLDTTVEEDLQPGIDAFKAEEKERMRNMVDTLPLERYEISTSSGMNREENDEWKEAKKRISKGDGEFNGTVSVKRRREDRASNEGSARGKDEKRVKPGSAVESAWKEAEKAKGVSGSKKSKKR